MEIQGFCKKKLHAEKTSNRGDGWSHPFPFKIVSRKIEISFLILETAAKASANSPKVNSEAKSRNLKQKIFHIFITAGVDFCNRVSVWSFASPLSLSLSLSLDENFHNFLFLLVKAVHYSTTGRLVGTQQQLMSSLWLELRCQRRIRIGQFECRKRVCRLTEMNWRQRSNVE